MSRTRATPGLIVCLLLALGGCGSHSSSTVSTSESVGTIATPPTAAEGDRGPKPPADADKGQGQGSRGGQRGSGLDGRGEGHPAPEGSGSGKYKADNSLQTFGTEVGGPLKEEVTRAVHSFFRALAAPDYPAICAGVAKSNLETIQKYAELRHVPEKGCPAVLAKLLPPPNAQTRRSTHSTITHIRVRRGETIVFLRLPGGKVNYLPMVREGGMWKSVTLVPGIPVNPTFSE